MSTFSFPPITAQLLSDFRHRQPGQAIRVAKHKHPFPRGPPNLFRRVTPQDQAGQAHCRGKVRNAGVVADEGAAACQPVCQLRQRQTLRHLRSRRGKRCGQTLQPLAFRFSAHHEQIQVRGIRQVPQQLGPFRFRPILPIAAAAGMKRQRGC